GPQSAEGEEVDPRVDLANSAFLFGGVLLLDDPVESAALGTDDASVARRVVEERGEERRCGLGLAVSRDERRQGLGVEERNVTVHDEDVAVEILRKRFDGLLDGTAGAGDLI